MRNRDGFNCCMMKGNFELQCLAYAIPCWEFFDVAAPYWLEETTQWSSLRQ
jgi:hypothetical protein